MNLDQLAQRLADRIHIGLTPELVEKLRLRTEDAVRGQLAAQLEEDHGHLGVYLIGTYVVDDTDFWGDGDVYWWSIPALVDREGKATWNQLIGLPNGSERHRVGSHEWLQNISLATPPLLGIIPPTEEVASFVLRLGFYEDDGVLAQVGKAMTAGLEALVPLAGEPQDGVEALVQPVRKAILTSLKFEQDDILIDQDLTLRRGETMRFGVGLIGSEMNSLVRVYYFVRDEKRTQQFGPIQMRKGQTETVKFDTPMVGAGRIAMFARGGDVSSSFFGDINTDTPFINRVVDGRMEASLSHGFSVTANGPAKLVAYYTPPEGA